MAQLHTINRNNTTVVPRPDCTVVTLHQTDIVRVYPDRVELDTGGYLTATTITRMNQVANQMGLGFAVSRAGGLFTARLGGYREIVSKDGRTLTVPRE